jgi:hypothetical protein
VRSLEKITTSALTSVIDQGSRVVGGRSSNKLQGTRDFDPKWFYP